MILCVILLWPSKIKISLILMQNVFKVFWFEDKLIENLVFGRFGSNSRVFEKLFISNSCILFIKYCALRSFYIKMLCFSKTWFFQIFYQSNLLLNRSKLRLKIWFKSAWLDRYLIDSRSIECVFRSIEPIFWPIKNRWESFLKHELFMCSSLFQKFSKSYSLSLWLIQIQSQIFVVFPQIFLKVFVV